MKSSKSLIRHYNLLGFEFDNFDLIQFFVILIGYISIIIILFFNSIITVNAAGTIVENYDTEYNISIPEDIIDLSLVLDQQGTTLQEFLQTIIDTDSPYYGIKINLRYSSANALIQIGLSLYDQSIDNFEISTFGRNTANTSIQSRFMDPQTRETFQHKAYNINTTGSLPANIYQNTTYINFQLCYLSNDCNIASTPTRWGNQFSRYSTNTYFNNNNSYNISKTSGNETNIFYYLSDTMTLKNDFCDTSSTYTCYMKTIKINDVTYNIGDTFPTYYDLYLRPDEGFSYYQAGLGSFLVGSIPKANINNFKIDLSFNYLDYEYVNNFSTKSYFYGRKNNSTYYSYEQLSCTSSTINNLTIDTTNNKVSGSIYPNGFTCSSDLTNYDYIYILFRFVLPSDVSYNTVISNLSYKSSYGNIKSFINSFIDKYDLRIYEKFDNIANIYSYLLSTNVNLSYAYYETDNKLLTFVNVDRINNIVKNIAYNPISFGTVPNVNALLFSDISTNNYNLNLYFNPNSILSISDINTFTYYDSTNTIDTDTIVNDVIVSNDDNYDLSYYFNVVNNYINSLQSDMLEFHNVVQNTYDLIPETFSIMILTLFIFGCLYIVWNLIKK